MGAVQTDALAGPIGSVVHPSGPCLGLWVVEVLFV